MYFFFDINVAFVAVLVSGRGGVGFSEVEEEDLTADCSFSTTQSLEILRLYYLLD